MNSFRMSFWIVPVNCFCATPCRSPTAMYIASSIKSNIRELEGSLIRLLAYASLTGLPLTIELAQDVLRNVIDHDERAVTLEQMLYHCSVVARGVERALVIGDMPFMSFQVNADEALRNADAVNDLRIRFKLEGKAAKGLDSMVQGAADLSLERDLTRKLGIKKDPLAP